MTKSLIQEGAFKLKPYDLVYVRNDPYFDLQKISLLKERFYIQSILILSSKEKLSDVIERAGGLTDAGLSRGLSFTKTMCLYIDFEKIRKTPKNKTNLIY